MLFYKMADFEQEKSKQKCVRTMFIAANLQLLKEKNQGNTSLDKTLRMS